MDVVGAVGFVSVIGARRRRPLRALVDAAEAGDFANARELHAATAPGPPGDGPRAAASIFAKAALRLRGFDVGDPRLPQIPATAEQIGR